MEMNSGRLAERESLHRRVGATVWSVANRAGLPDLPRIGKRDSSAVRHRNDKIWRLRLFRNVCHSDAERGGGICDYEGLASSASIPAESFRSV